MHPANATWKKLIEIRVIGKPKTAGSKVGFVNPKTGGVIITEGGSPVVKREKANWRAVIQAAAMEACEGMDLLDEPIGLGMEFVFSRPAGHMGTGRNAGTLRAKAPDFPAVKPDLTKLVRAAEDALTGVVYRDDSRVVCHVDPPCKRYAEGSERQGAIIRVYVLASVPVRAEGLFAASAGEGG